MAHKDLTGRRLGRLVPFAIERECRGARQELLTFYLCRCDCGKETRVRSKSLTKTKTPTRSCGCLKHDTAPKLEHGDAVPGRKASEYTTWQGMLVRCRYPSATGFQSYGGRGIAVCARWREGEGGKSGYVCFLSDMGRKPSPDHSIDRIDNDGNYEPGNCRWALPDVQRSNTSRTKTIELDGETLTVCDASARFGVPGKIIRERLKRGWSVSAALNLPQQAQA